MRGSPARVARASELRQQVVEAWVVAIALEDDGCIVVRNERKKIINGVRNGVQMIVEYAAAFDHAPAGEMDHADGLRLNARDLSARIEAKVDAVRMEIVQIE